MEAVSSINDIIPPVENSPEIQSDASPTSFEE